MAKAVDFDRFDKLPNHAAVSVGVVVLVTEMSEATVWRRAKTEPLLKSIRFGPGCTRFNVGNLRRFLAEGATQ